MNSAISNHNTSKRPENSGIQSINSSNVSQDLDLGMYSKLKDSKINSGIQAKSEIINLGDTSEERLDILESIYSNSSNNSEFINISKLNFASQIKKDLTDTFELLIDEDEERKIAEEKLHAEVSKFTKNPVSITEVIEKIVNNPKDFPRMNKVFVNHLCQAEHSIRSENKELSQEDLKECLNQALENSKQYLQEMINHYAGLDKGLESIISEAPNAISSNFEVIEEDNQVDEFEILELPADEEVVHQTNQLLKFLEEKLGLTQDLNTGKLISSDRKNIDFKTLNDPIYEETIDNIVANNIVADKKTENPECKMLHEFYNNSLESHQEIYKDHVAQIAQKNPKKAKLIADYEKVKNSSNIFDIIWTFFMSIPYKISSARMKELNGEDQSVSKARADLKTMINYAYTIKKQTDSIPVILAGIDEIKARQMGRNERAFKHRMYFLAEKINKYFPINLVPDFKKEIELDFHLGNLIDISKEMINNIKDSMPSFETKMKTNFIIAGYNEMCRNLSEKVDELVKLKNNPNKDLDQMQVTIEEAQELKQVVTNSTWEQLKAAVNAQYQKKIGK